MKFEDIWSPSSKVMMIWNKNVKKSFLASSKDLHQKAKIESMSKRLAKLSFNYLSNATKNNNELLKKIIDKRPTVSSKPKHQKFPNDLILDIN